MTAIAEILRNAGFVSAASALPRQPETAESKAGSHASAASAVSVENDRSCTATVPALRTDCKLASLANPAVDVPKIRAHMLALAVAECLPARLVHVMDDEIVATADGLSDLALVEWLRLREAGEQIGKGLVPPLWRGRQGAICAGCGPVYLWPGAPAHVQACPWCAGRLRGIEPQRAPVTCAGCRHYIRGRLNPADAFGSCASGHSSRYPTELHACREPRGDGR
ncbi:MAG: hypothetical protein JSR34_09175 [Proteobacteria bacterium]|nr:hypothetical protein [Pseudomonadota bacterium]